MSSKRHENPYRAGDYNKAFEYLQKKQIVTIAEFRKYIVDTLGKTETAAKAMVTVILSPRKSSKRGDCRGNLSSAGHLYFMAKLGRKVRAGVKDPQRFKLCWREVALEPHRRIAHVVVKQVKVATKTKATKTPKITKVEDKAEVVG